MVDQSISTTLSDMPNPKRLHVMPIRLDDETKADLAAAAEAERRSMSNLAYLILRDWLDDWKKKQGEKR